MNCIINYYLIIFAAISLILDILGNRCYSQTLSRCYNQPLCNQKYQGRAFRHFWRHLTVVWIIQYDVKWRTSILLLRHLNLYSEIKQMKKIEEMTPEEKGKGRLTRFATAQYVVRWIKGFNRPGSYRSLFWKKYVKLCWSWDNQLPKSLSFWANRISTNLVFKILLCPILIVFFLLGHN